MTISDVRPFWMNSAHAKWCQNDHTRDLHPDDHVCWGALAEVPMTMEKPSRSRDLSEGFLAQLFQESPDSEPVVSIGINYAQVGWHITLEEAERFAFTLTRLVAIARGQSTAGGSGES